MAKVLVFSDIHDDFISENAEKRLKQRFESASPDLVATLGDIRKNAIRFIAETVAKYSIPVVSVRGNHDPYPLTEVPQVIDMHRKVGRFSGITIAGIEGCVKYAKSENHPAGYDDSNAGIVLDEGDYTKEKDYSWVVENFTSPDGMFIGKLPEGIDLLMLHCAPVNGRSWPHESPPTLTRLLYTQHPKTVVHGHLHRDIEYIFNPDKNPVRLINVYTPNPFDSAETAGKMVKIPNSGIQSQLNHEIVAS